MIEFSKIFNGLVDQISNEIKVESQDNMNYYTCNTKWARKGKTVTGFDIDGFPQTSIITDVVYNELITLKTALIVDTLILNAPFDITGTKIATNLEWSKASNLASNKLPLVWLLDTFDEKEEGLESALERTVDCKIFFLDETDIKNYYTADHKAQVVQPMIGLKDEFLKVIKNNRNYKTIENVQIKYFSRFGTESAQGFEKNILDANLSGLLLSVTLQKFKGNCKC